MPKMSAALKRYRKQLTDMEEMSRATMTQEESDRYSGFRPGMDKQEIDDATEMAVATKTEDEAKQLLSEGKSLSKKADQVKEDREWKEFLRSKREQDIARQQRLNDAVVRSDVLARRGEGLLPLPKELMGSEDDGLAIGLDPTRLKDDDLLALGMNQEQIRKYRGR